MSETQTQAAGVIHDLGYRRYDGPRMGRAQIVRALTWHSFRSAFGIGRGVKAKIIPILAIIAICLPAFVNAFAVARGNPRLFGYDVYVPQLRVIVVTIFIAAQAPELVSRDLRSHVLPLYFSRPLRRLDYPLAKYIALTAACLLLVEVPLLILYLGTIASAKSSHGVWAETRALIPGLGVGLMWAVLLAAVGLALASLTGRRAYATGIVAIACFLTWTLSLLLIEVPLLILYVGTIASAKNSHGVWSETRALIPGLGVGLMWAVLMAAVGLVLASLTGRRAYATGIVAIACFLTWTVSETLIQIEGGITSTSTGARIGGLFSPFNILDGVRIWLGGTSQGEDANPGHFGPLYGVVAVLLLAACLGGLAARYRKVSQS